MRRMRIGALIVVGLLLAGAAGVAALRAADRPEDHQIVLIIPAGATRREAAGQPGVELPKRLTLTLGQRDTLVIRNEDGFVARVGPFRMEPGQSFSQRFRRTGEVALLCTTLYHEETIQIAVVERRGLLERWVGLLVRGV